MRIIHVEDYFDPKAGYQINELLIASKGLGDDVFLITSKDMAPFHKELDLESDKEFEIKTGVKILRLDTIIKISTRLVLKKLRKTIDELQPDVVFMHGIGDFKDLFFLWGKKCKFKIYRDCHMSWVASKNKLRHVYYLAYSLFFASIINSTSKYDMIYALGVEEYEYLRKLGIKSEKIDYLLHGYNSTNMYFDLNERMEIRRIYSLNLDDIVISYIGKFNSSKRPDILLDIIEMMDKEYIISNKLKLLFVGPKDENYMSSIFNEKLERLKNKIDMEIILVGAQEFDKLRKYYSASDICIFPKETSLSSIHAQVCMCQVMMEDYESNKERVINKKNLYKKDNLLEASSILRRLVDNKDYKKENIDNHELLNREYKNQVSKLKERILYGK